MKEKKIDLRSLVLLTTLNNENQKKKGDLNTQDFIYIQNDREIENKSFEERKAALTDFASLNGGVSSNSDVTLDGRKTTLHFLRDSYDINYVKGVYWDGTFTPLNPKSLDIGIRPALRLDLKSFLSFFNRFFKTEEHIAEIFNEVRGADGSYHTIQLGEYPQFKVGKKLNRTLEDFFKNSDKQLSSTGRWFTVNGQKEFDRNWIPKQIPEFKCETERFVRVIPSDNADVYLSNNSKIKENNVWLRVSPISFKIENWDDLPKIINPDGNGKANVLILVSEDCLLSGIPFYPNKEDLNRALWESSTIRGFLNGIDIRKIKENKNQNLGTLNDENFINESFFNQAFNLSRKKVFNYTISKNDREIADLAFAGCINLNTVVIHKNIEKIGDNAFAETGLNFVSKTKNNEIILSRNPIKSKKLVSTLNISDFEQVFSEFDVGKICKEDVDFEGLELLTKKLINTKNLLPFNFVEKLIENNQIKSFISSDLKGFKKIQKLIPNDIDKKNLANLYTVSYNIGCFSKNASLNQRANEWLYQRITPVNNHAANKNLKNFEADLPLSKMGDFKNWKPKGENEEFSNFLFDKSAEKKTSVFEEIKEQPNFGHFIKRIYEEYSNPEVNLEEGGRFRNKDNKLMFARFYSGVTKQGEETLKRKDRQPSVSLFKEYFSLKKFDGVKTSDDKAIAKELGKWMGMEQKYFDKAKAIMEIYRKKNLPSNITGSHLKDFSLEIADYIKQTENLFVKGINASKKILRELSDDITKEFSYEWLEKNDPKNFCLGLYCNCCANLAGVGCGILQANFIHPDVQNLVIKNKKGLPIAKSTIYVNKEEGYGVFNNVEVENNISDEQKQEIYDSYKRGVNAFATEYNLKNPDNPLKKITVGMKMNDLTKQIEKGCSPSDALKGLDFDKYEISQNSEDWGKGGQYLLWSLSSQNKMEVQEQ